jgi:hypothetical protein
VDVEADAMPGPVRQARRRITRPEASAVDDAARGGIDVLAAIAGLGGGKARGLRFLLQIPDLALALVRLTQTSRILSPSTINSWPPRNSPARNSSASGSSISKFLKWVTAEWVTVMAGFSDRWIV